MDARSIALLEFPAVRARLADKTSFPPSRRLAEALEPSDDPVIVRRRLDETDQARSLLQDRAGVGHRVGPRHRAVDRAGRPGRPAGPGPLPGGGRDARRDRAPPDVACRGAATAAPGGRPPAAPPARPPQHAAAQLRPDGRAARHRVAAPGCAAGLRPRRLRPPPAAAGQPGRIGARGRAPGADHHDAQRALRRPDPRRGPREGQGHRPRRVRERPDAVRRAARGGGAGQRVARGHRGGQRGGGPDPRRAVVARRRERDVAARDARGARRVRPLGGEGPARGGARRRPAGPIDHGGRRAALARHPGADRPRGADRPAARRRATRPS